MISMGLENGWMGRGLLTRNKHRRRAVRVPLHVQGALWKDGHLVLVERAAANWVNAVLRHKLKYTPLAWSRARTISETHHICQSPFGNDVDLRSSWMGMRSIEAAGANEAYGHGYACPYARWE